MTSRGRLYFHVLFVGPKSTTIPEGNAGFADMSHEKGRVRLGATASYDDVLAAPEDIGARGSRQNYVQHLALAGIIGAVEVARAYLDAKDALGGNAREGHLQGFRLRSRTGPVEHDIACRPGKPAHVDLAEIRLRAAEIEREARNAAGDIQRSAWSELRKI